MAIRIALADDHQIFREGLRALLERQSDVKVVVEADDGHAALKGILAEQVDIAILDIALPNLNGIELTRRLLDQAPGMKIIALSMHAEKRFVIEMFRAGASAYLLKNSAFSELMSVVRQVMQGYSYLSPRLAGQFMINYMHQVSPDTASPFDVLTSREREVLQLLSEGLTTKEIAQQLFISTNTADSYRKQIMEKLNLHSVAELTRYAIREGITSLQV